METNVTGTMNAWRARARGWLAIAAVVMVGLPLLAFAARLVANGSASTIVTLLPHGLLFAAALCLARGATPGAPKLIAMGAAVVKAGHLVLSFTHVALAPVLFSHEGLGTVVTLFGYLVTLASVTSAALLAYAIAITSEPTPFTPIAAGAAAAAGVLSFLPRFFSFVGSLVSLPSLGDPGGTPLTIPHLLGDTTTDVLFVALAALGMRSLAPGVGPGADLPEPLRESGEGLRSLVTWSRIRAVALLVAVLLAAAAALGHGGDVAGHALPIPLALIALGTSPFLLRAHLRLLRAPETSGVRGPAIASLVLFVLHGICDLPWIVFLFALSRGRLSSGDFEPVPFMIVATGFTACMVDSAVALAAVRLGRALEVTVSAGALQSLVWAAYFGSQCLGGAGIAATGGDEDVTFVIALFVMVLGFGTNALAQRQMLRATRLG